MSRPAGRATSSAILLFSRSCTSVAQLDHLHKVPWALTTWIPQFCRALLSTHTDGHLIGCLASLLQIRLSHWLIRRSGVQSCDFIGRAEGDNSGRQVFCPLQSGTREGSVDGHEETYRVINRIICNGR